ncbi:LamG-like jellyroll fold domain-containing protein [Planotetraspora sp. GP83]|uniref:LamG-like jellyroll fold domain-containing protein n=1 Tax=Planotetraspora sp. GP83 TaxID=3156264 RepID=UPI00351601AB
MILGDLAGKGSRKRLFAAVVTASLLSGAAVPAAADDAQPSQSPASFTAPPPSKTAFPKPDDTDADLRTGIAEAKKQNKPVEVKSAGTESSWSWAYPDGHIATETWAGPARVKQVDGSFRWIDTTLTERDGSLQPKVAKADIRFSNGGNTELASLERDSDKQRFALEWPTPLPKPQIQGNKAVYTNAAGPSADLVVTALATGFRHDVVLRERPTGPVEFRLPVQSKGLKLGETKAGGLKLTDSKGKTVASAATPYMAEAPSADVKSLPNQRGEIDAEVVTESDGRQVLVIKPDPKFLADEKTTYPVTVDPTVTLTATTDAWVQSKTGAADSTGSVLNVGTGTYWQSERRCTGSVCTYTNKIYPNFLRGYVSFGDTSGFANKYVESASVQLLGSYSGSCVSRTITMSPITSSWSTSSLSWSSLPGTSSTGAVTITPSCGSGVVSTFDVTQMAKGWASGSASNGVELKSTEDPRTSWPDDPNPVSAQYWSFNSVESGQSPPKLSVNYLLPPEIPTVTGESIDSMVGNDAISRTSDVKVNYSSTSIDGKKLDYLVSISDPTTPIPVPTATPSPTPTPSPSPSPSPTQTGVPGLVAAYGMNEGTGTAVADVSGTGNAGTASAATWATGKYGQALSFNGTSSTVTVSDAASLRITGKLTLEAWVNPTTLGATRPALVKEAASGPAYGLHAGLKTCTAAPFMCAIMPTYTYVPSSQVKIGGTGYSATGTTALPTGSWSHIASVYDGTTVKTYVNGSPVATTSVSGANDTSTSPLRIGADTVAGTYFSGLIDEVRVYNIALTQAQVQSDMTTPVTVWTPPVDNPPTAPGTLTAVAGPDTVALSWGAATDDKPGVTYEVHRSTTSGFTPSATTKVATTSTTSYTDSGMVQGQYYYRVVAVDSASHSGPPSNEVAARTSAQLFPPISGANSGQVISNQFKLGSPDSFKFKIKACLAGITPRMCNETPYYRITTDAPWTPTNPETGMEDPFLPILSGMVARPSNGPVSAKFYLFDKDGLPVGSSPLAQVAVNGGERASFQLSEGTVAAGGTYSWQMQACAEEICSSRTNVVSFTVPGTPSSETDDVHTLNLMKDNFVIKVGKTDPTACDGAPCALSDSSVIQVGGEGPQKLATAVGFRLDALPDGAAVVDAVLNLGSAICPPTACPADRSLTVVPLKNPVTSDTNGADLLKDADTTTSYTLPVTAPHADISASDAEYGWVMITSDGPEPIGFGAPEASEQPKLALTYFPPGPPSKVLNLTAEPADSGAIAAWGLPEKTGGMAMLDGYDIQVLGPDGSVRGTYDVPDPTATIDGLTNGVTYTVKVRAHTVYGTGDWESTSVTPKPLIGPCGISTYVQALNDYYAKQIAVLEGAASDVWAAGAAPAGKTTARLALDNPALIAEKQSMDAQGIARKNSVVTITHAVGRDLSDGRVQVNATVEQTWNITKIASGETDSETSADEVVYTFGRCGELGVDSESVDVEEDSTDFAYDDAFYLDDDADQNVVGGSPAEARAGSMKTMTTSARRVPCGRAQNGDGYYATEDTYRSTKSNLIRFTEKKKNKKKVWKGWWLSVHGCSRWYVPWIASTPTTDSWRISENINYVRVQGPSNWPRNEAKYIKSNLYMESSASACFLGKRFNGAFGVSIDTSRTGAVSVEVSGSKEIVCKDYTETGPDKPSTGGDFILYPIWNRHNPRADCFMNATTVCQVEGYQHIFTPKVKLFYHPNNNKYTPAYRVLFAPGEQYSPWMKYDGTRYSDW